MNKITSICVALLVMFLLAVPALAAQQPTLTIRPNLVAIGTSFNGAQLAINGQVPAGTTAVIRLLGEPQNRHFKQKGRALGVLWMNLKSVEIERVPDVFLVGNDGRSGINWEHSDLGFQSVKGDTDGPVFDEFIKLMEQDGYYEIEDGVVDYGTVENSRLPFTATLSIPSAMHKGVYQVEVLAVKDGQVVGRASEELHTRLSGLPAVLSRFAFDHSLTYGIAAVVIAILAGLFMSMLFKESGGAH